MLTREFYHNAFTEALLEMYVPIMVDLMHLYFQHVCTPDVKTEDQCIELFRSLLNEKVEKVKKDPMGTFKALMESFRAEHGKLVTAASINYRKMHSSDAGLAVKKIDDSDIFSCIFLSVAREMYRHAVLFLKAPTQREQYQNSVQIEEYIIRGVRTGIHDAFRIMFVDSDRAQTIKDLHLIKDGKKIPIDVRKLLDIFEKEGIDIDLLTQKMEGDFLRNDFIDEESSTSSSSSSSSSSDSEEEEEKKEEGIIIEGIQAPEKTPESGQITLEEGTGRPKISINDHEASRRPIILNI